MNVILQSHSQESRARYFVDHSFRRFFVPSLLSSIGIALGSMVDCLVVGSKLGETGLSAIALGIPVYMFYNLLSYGFSIGGSIHFASSLGKGEPDAGVRIFNNVLRFLIVVYLATVVLGLVFLPQLLRLLGADPAYPEVYAIAKNYVRAQLLCVPVMFCQGPFYYFVHCDNAPKLAAAAFVISNTVDILLNYVFVIRMDMGAQGSVYSTAIGASFCLIICMSHILRKQGSLRFRWPALGTEDLILAIRTGFSSSVQYIYMFVTVLVMNQLLLRIGGPGAVAVFDVVYNLSQFAAAVSDGVGITLQPMVSTYRAEHNRSAMGRTMSLSIRWGAILSLGVALCLVVGAGALCSLFGLRGEALGIGVTALRIYSFSIIFAMLNQVLCYYYQTVDLEKVSFLIQSLRLFVCYLAAAFLLAPLGLNVFWWIFPLSEIGALCYIAVFHYRKRREAAVEGEQVFSVCIEKNDVLGSIIEELQDQCNAWDCKPSQAFTATLVVEELCVAVFEDADRNARQNILIQLTAVAEEGSITLHLRDNSLRFNPFEVETGEHTIYGLESEDGPNALGMVIVKKKAREFFYRRYLGFNTLVVKL